jgi:hypothetical protein
VTTGLELIIHDGGEGLCAALHIAHFDAAQQRGATLVTAKTDMKFLRKGR